MAAKVVKPEIFPLGTEYCCTKVVKIEIFPLCIGYSCTTLQVKNLCEIAQSPAVFRIFTLFHFLLKSKMAAKSGENGRRK